MNTETYTYLLANPQEVSLAQIEELDAIIEQYPFFQIERLWLNASTCLLPHLWKHLFLCKYLT